MKVLPLKDGDNFTHMFFCEGCGCGHGFNVSIPNRPIWSYNNNPDKPTISPSILVTYPRENGQANICHSYVTDGKIQYLSDSTHRLAGQTVELTEMD